MKNIFIAFAAAISLITPAFAVFGAETKKVCIEQMQKNGKKKEVCKQIKVHKKLDGTPVPNQKK
jgi:hypothetical protein